MRHPITVCVLVIAVALASLLALQNTSRDILPSLGVPIIYVAQPYGGLDPAQMESYVTYYYEYHFLYIAGIEHVESKSIQSTALIKLQFHPGTDMAQAMAETINYVNRARAFMPPGTLPPFVMRFDAGSEPVGKLVFSGPNHTLGELQNYALNFVRPLFATLPGVSAPPPFGSSARTIVIEVDPQKLANHSLSPDQISNAVALSNTITPSGNIHVGDDYPIVPVNSVVTNINELLEVPIRMGTGGATTYLKDVATVKDTTDIPTGYALVNGKRTVYIPVTKRSDASTLTVVDLVKKNLPRFQAVVPEDVKVTYEFDQSGYVKRAINSLFLEVVLGALLTGLMVLVFLRDWRSVLIVGLNIPLALLSSLFALWISKQTVNIMSLGGLALAVGILVDETTVTIENIHTHIAKGASIAQAALEGTQEILRPALLTLLCVLSVFIPSFFMQGIAHALFVPLTLAVGFSMSGSFILSRTLVPVLCAWLLKKHSVHTSGSNALGALGETYKRTIEGFLKHSKTVVVLYLCLIAAFVVYFGSRIGTEVFPQVETNQFQVRLRTPTGRSIEATEKAVLEFINLVKHLTGDDNVESTVGFVGTQPPSYPINDVYLWTSGPSEAVLEVALKPEAKINIPDLKEKIRQAVKKDFPTLSLSFEPSSLVDRAMSQGSNTPVEISVNGKDLAANKDYAQKIFDALSGLDFLRDLQFGQRFDYPALAVDVDRKKAGLLGLSVSQVGQSLVPATSSSRYLVQNYWRDPKNGINYQVQVQVPQNQVTSVKDLEDVPIAALYGDAFPLSHYAKVSETKEVAEYDRYNMQRMVTVTANLHDIDLGHAAKMISEKLKPLENQKPRGTELRVRGQVAALDNVLKGLGTGLLLAIAVVFLLLASNFESVSLAFTVLSTIPSVVSGSLLMLLLTGTTLNIESFMGTIMAVGVAVANAILLVTFAERHRLQKNPSDVSALFGATTRLRPILMTSAAMLAGMVPMALGLGEGGQQTAPLGRAVIGGLLGATVATLFVLPLVYSWIQKHREAFSASLDPSDKSSRLFVKTSESRS